MRVSSLRGGNVLSPKVIKAVTESIVFLTKAKHELFPESFIQARGYIGADSEIEMEKRLVWLSPSHEAMELDELAKGKRTVRAWLKAAVESGVEEMSVFIVGDENPATGMLPDTDTTTNWLLDLRLLKDEGSLSVNFWGVPPDVMRRMHENNS
jgi:hypothetical protein